MTWIHSIDVGVRHADHRLRHKRICARVAATERRNIEDTDACRAG